MLKGLLLLKGRLGLEKDGFTGDAIVLFGVLFFVFLRGSLNLPSIGDRWGMSRLLSYEGDSPQELQNEIERLRAQMGQADQPKQ